MDSRPTETPEFPLPKRTFVHERDGEPLMWLDGLLPLPVGTLIRLDDLPGVTHVVLDPDRFPTGRADAVVVSVELAGIQGDDPSLVLVVDLEGSGEPLG